MRVLRFLSPQHLPSKEARHIDRPKIPIDKLAEILTSLRRGAIYRALHQVATLIQNVRCETARNQPDPSASALTIKPPSSQAVPNRDPLPGLTKPALITLRQSYYYWPQQG
jgi:hypothetical protein